MKLAKLSHPTKKDPSDEVANHRIGIADASHPAKTEQSNNSRYRLGAPNGFEPIS
jgi:putative hemolysin